MCEHDSFTTASASKILNDDPPCDLIDPLVEVSTHSKYSGRNSHHDLNRLQLFGNLGYLQEARHDGAVGEHGETRTGFVVGVER